MLTRSRSEYVCDELVRKGCPVTSSQRSLGRGYRRVLASLVASTSRGGDLLDKIWGATHDHVKRGCAGYFDSLLYGESAVEELLECFRREPLAAVRLVIGNE